MVPSDRTLRSAPPCASTSSTPPPSPRPTTARCGGAGARAGADVELVTSRFAYGAVPAGRGLRGAASASTAARPARPARGCARAAKLAEHVPDMLRYRRAARAADVVHFQWLAVQPLDAPPAAARGARSCSPRTTCCRASRGRASARRSGGCTSASTPSSCTPSTAAARLTSRSSGVDPRRGARDPARRVRRTSPTSPSERPLPAELAAVRRAGRAVLRPAAPLQGPRRAARGLARHRGRRAVDRRHAADGHRAAARRRAAGRALRRRASCADAELPAVLRRADLVVLPYREIDQSGVLFTALAFGSRCCSATSAASPRSPRPAPPSSSRPATRRALHAALRARCSPTPARRAALAAAARRGRRGPYSWDGDRRAHARALPRARPAGVRIRRRRPR